MRNAIFAVLILALGLHSCVKAPTYPIEPHIEFKSLSATNMLSGYADTITVSFTDGDGDLAVGISNGDTCNLCGLKTGDSACLRSLHAFNVFVIDSRDSCINTFATADVRPTGKYKGISGDIEIITAVTTHQCNCPCNKSDSLSYTIVIRDLAGHLSNFVRTPTISVVCAP